MGQAPPGDTCNRSQNGTVFVKAGEFGSLHPLIREWTTKPLKMARSGDVLVCVVGATAGKLNLAVDAAIGRSVAAIRPTSALDTKFLYYTLLPRVQELRRGSAGSAQGVISQADLGAITLLLPPIAEQYRIVCEVEELRAKAGIARTALAKTPELLDRLRQSVLASAFRGDLTAGWRANNPDVEPAAKLLSEIRHQRRAKWDAGVQEGTNKRRTYPEPRAFSSAEMPDLPVGWEWTTVEHLSTKVTDGVHSKPVYVDAGVPFITVKNLTAGPGLSFENTKYISEDDHREFTRRTAPEKGDILVSKDGTLGVVRRIESDCPFSIFVSVALIKPVSDLIGEYLAQALTSPQVQAGMKATGTGLQHIHLVDLRATPIPLPPEKEIPVLLARLKDRLELTALRKAQQGATEGMYALEQAILAKAFRGELVPQDPDDEPASVLLERIRAEREAQGERKGGRRKRATAASGQG